MSTLTDPFPKGPAAGPRPNFRSTALLTLLIYLAGWVLIIAGGFIGGVADFIAQSRIPGADPFASFNQPLPFLALALILAGFLCFLLSIIFFAVLLYALWGVVQDGYASLSPGVAVALTCIPIVNLVGLFFGFSGLARQINRVGIPMNQGRPLVSEGLALASCICYVSGAVAGCLPIIGCLFGLAGAVGIVLRYVSLFSMCRACEWIVLSGGPPPYSPYRHGSSPHIDAPNAFDPPTYG